MKEEKAQTIDFEWSIKKVKNILSNARNLASSKNLSVALENMKFNLIHPVCLMQALTLRSSSDEFDLEWLEVLGDAFLKFAIGDYVFLFADGGYHDCFWPKAKRFMNSQNVT